MSKYRVTMRRYPELTASWSDWGDTWFEGSGKRVPPATSSAPFAFRKDGWPLCPSCGEDELWSPIWNSDRPRPPLADFLAGPLACYRCGWRKEAG